MTLRDHDKWGYGPLWVKNDINGQDHRGLAPLATGPKDFNGGILRHTMSTSFVLSNTPILLLRFAS